MTCEELSGSYLRGIGNVIPFLKVFLTNYFKYQWAVPVRSHPGPLDRA